MTSVPGVAQAAAFVVGTSGSRFRLVSEPTHQALRGTIIFVHGFAEEMNKSRRMATRMARLFAADGWRVVQRDLCGCGDSSGEFADASWAAWIDDVAAELSLAAKKRPVWLWCIRSGALLAPSVLLARSDVNLLLWQPVLSGAQHLQQFLRLQAGARISGSANAGSGQSPAKALRAGMSVEVGGYQLSPALAMGMEQATFDLPLRFSGRIVWFELSADEDLTLSAMAARAVERLAASGVIVRPRVLLGPPFWQTQEIEECESLLEETLAELRGDHPPQSVPGSGSGGGKAAIGGIDGNRHA
jgi:uncharacterized protein